MSQNHQVEELKAKLQACEQRADRLERENGELGKHCEQLAIRVAMLEAVVEQRTNENNLIVAKLAATVKAGDEMAKTVQEFCCSSCEYEFDDDVTVGCPSCEKVRIILSKWTTTRGAE